MDQPATESDHRVEAQVSAEQKELFQRAADMQGRSLADFVVASAHEAATRVIEEMRPISLNAQESRAFAEVMLTPGEPSQRLRAAAQRYLDISSNSSRA